MIRSFRSKLAERLFDRERVPKFSPTMAKVALRKLTMLDAATVLDDLRVPPGNRLERLQGDRKEQYSIRINEQWRICFTFRDGNVYDVEIVDYH